MPAATTAAENTALLEQVFAQEPGKAAQELSINKSSVQRIFRKVLKLFPYRLRIVQILHAEDYGARAEVCESLLHHYENDPQLLKKHATATSLSSISLVGQTDSCRI